MTTGIEHVLPHLLVIMKNKWAVLLSKALLASMNCPMPFTEGYWCLLQSVLVNTGAHLVSAPLKRYIVMNKRQFWYSHDFAQVPLAAFLDKPFANQVKAMAITCTLKIKSRITSFNQMILWISICLTLLANMMLGEWVEKIWKGMVMQWDSGLMVIGTIILKAVLNETDLWCHLWAFLTLQMQGNLMVMTCWPPSASFSCNGWVCQVSTISATVIWWHVWIDWWEWGVYLKVFRNQYFNGDFRSHELRTFKIIKTYCKTDWLRMKWPIWQWQLLLLTT